MDCRVTHLVKRGIVVISTMAVLGLFSCSSVADGDPEEIDPISSSSRARSSSSVEPLSSSDKSDSVSREDSLSMDLVKFSKISAQVLSRGATEYSVDSFEISKTEVTQELYSMVMGGIPEMDKVGDDIAVANVTWFDAALFCNALSKKFNLDTAYVYDGVESSGSLKNLEIDYSVKSIRLPTETEWEIAARGGTTTTYYWGTAVASKYAYYAQTNGPVKTAQYIPNEYDLYDMGGNVAEWVNDWYGTYSTQNVRNYTGVASGTYRVIRGGGWSSKATAMASSEREKKEPLYRSQMVGFRIARSNGF